MPQDEQIPITVVYGFDGGVVLLFLGVAAMLGAAGIVLWFVHSRRGRSESKA